MRVMPGGLQRFITSRREVRFSARFSLFKAIMSSIDSLFDDLRKWNAAIAIMVPRDNNGVALRAVIVVEGQPETDEILAAVAYVQALWDKEIE